MRMLLALGLLHLFAYGASASGTSYPGIYKDNAVRLEIKAIGSGKYAGVIVSGDEVFQFIAQEQADALVGSFTVEDETVHFRLTLRGKTLTFASEGETYTLSRQEQDTPDRSRGAAAPAGSTVPVRPLRINRAVIPDEQVRRFEQQHHQVIPRGDFWYDNVSGAWGLDGGPTVGFTAPGMNLGGKLAADASGGDTGVFINGRELPVQDVAGLAQMGVPVQQGRWWVDARGNFGVEGSPNASGNLFQFSRGKGGAYQRATVGGYIGGDGETSYFFDPATGASVMTGN